MQTRSKGFTLLELMVVVGIIAILAALVYPSYVREVVKTKRSKGAACLMEQAQFMERYYATNMGYTGAVLPSTACSQELASDYSFAFSVAPAATTYTLSATPRGRQAAKDSFCGTMSINEKGTKTVTGTSSPSDCL